MNKQEALEEIDKTGKQFLQAASNVEIESNSRSVATGVFSGLGIAKSVVAQIDEPHELNENQQAVLSWLIDCYKDDGDPVEAISDLYDETIPTEWKTCLDAAYETFDNQQKFQLLAAFAEWGMKEVGE